LRICHTVDGATMMPSPASSPWIRRYPHDSFSRARRSTTDRTVRRTGGRPERPRRDNRTHRRRTMSRCQRKTVAGVTISRNPARRPTGSVPASNASHARPGSRRGRSASSPQAEDHRTPARTRPPARHRSGDRADGVRKASTQAAQVVGTHKPRAACTQIGSGLSSSTDATQQSQRSSLTMSSWPGPSGM
jgi:hypothetical protein